MVVEKTVSQFLKEMRDAGVEFTFTATNGKENYKGRCYKKPDGELMLETKKASFI